MNSNWSYTPEKLELRSIRVKIGDILSLVRLKFDGWRWKTIGHLFYTTSKLFQGAKSVEFDPFHSNSIWIHQWWIQKLGVTVRSKKASNLTQIGRFRTLTPVWIHQWLRNLHKAWSCIVEVPYCFSRSYVKFQGHTALKSVKFDPDWAFPDCNSSLNSPMATKWCTKLEVA